MDQWEPRELPPLDDLFPPTRPTRPATTTPNATGPRNGTAVFTPAQHDFVNRFGDGAPRPNRTAQRHQLAAIRQARPNNHNGQNAQNVPNVQPLQPVQQPAQNAPLRPAAPTLPLRPPSQFKNIFDYDMLNTLKVSVDRGSVKVLGKEIGKGVGEFEDVIAAAHKLSASTNGSSAEAQACQLVIQQARAYCTAERKAAYDHEKSKGGKGDAKTVQKFDAALRMLREAQRLQQDGIDQAFRAGNPQSPAQREQAHGDRARQMAQTFGADRAASGTSEVHLIKNGEGKIGYAFKGVAGEPDSTGMPKGAGAAREAMASAMSNAVKAMTGLDFGFPDVTISSFGGETGALVEGLDGVSYDPNWLAGKVRAEFGAEPDLLYRKDFASDGDYEAAKKARFVQEEKRAARRKELEPELQKRKDAATALAQKMSGQELQKVLMSNYAMAQFDIKWDNMMMAPDGDGTKARPFDGGAGFLADEALAENDGLLDPGPGGAGYILLYDPVENSKELPAANADLDPAMRQQFLSIDLPALRQTMEAERARLAQDHGLGDQVLPDISMERSYKSIEIVQEILADANIRTTKDFVAAYCNRLNELRKPV